MPVLPDAKHERFAQHLAAGKTADESYELAGYKRHRGNASRLSANESVKARVAELQGRAAAKVELSKAWVLSRLIENADRAMQAEAVRDHEGNATGEYTYQGNVANRSLELLGKELGMFIDRKEQGKPGDFSRLSDDELDRTIAERARGISRPAHRERTTH